MSLLGSLLLQSNRFDCSSDDENDDENDDDEEMVKPNGNEASSDNSRLRKPFVIYGLSAAAQIFRTFNHCFRAVVLMVMNSSGFYQNVEVLKKSHLSVELVKCLSKLNAYLEKVKINRDSFFYNFTYTCIGLLLY